ncbi:actin-related protein 3 [Coccomyxa subellipsoidea C-169]|uniref:Actin-related protein 3 n=1 Tax=Coccomyxa subellipsoidea (strain C-169) TaxID=574566 RepID=I0ZAG1_COCSC|nr:actin-related protein 3 [Coccomyxa subellipsoidea C-169]EIE27630.1 actin-related protein 3 [Coccomyxa subellipsoidea C-169]|eukprot:XP_005652174.1 actin-related protein 3 [Coccomyxa subellipsoidea C-169]
MENFTTLQVHERPVVVMDNGSGYTKMGFHGNALPNFVIPTAISFGGSERRAAGPVSCSDDSQVYIGDEALSQHDHSVHYPIRHGVVKCWDHMERFWQQSIHRYLRVNSEDHNFILTEPPMNPPENRETAAEIMFETFNVPGLCIGVQAVLSLYAAFAVAEKGSKTHRSSLTGCVIDIGDGCTHIIPVSDGYVIASAIKSVPIAGRDVTSFVQQLMRDRKEPVPVDMSMDVARRIKETLCYTASDVVKEFAKHDAHPDKHSRVYTCADPRTGAEHACNVRHEAFLAPEVFFRPDFISDEYTTPLPQLVDRVIQSCPIDTRRALYGNIVLSGGSTMFKDFGRRLQRDLQKAVAARQPLGGRPVDVRVAGAQRFGVWFGGSVLGMMPHFGSMCCSRAEYQERGFRASVANNDGAA